MGSRGVGNYPAKSERDEHKGGNNHSAENCVSRAMYFNDVVPASFSRNNAGIRKIRNNNDNLLSRSHAEGSLKARGAKTPGCSLLG